MAFVSTDLALVAVCNTNSTRKSIWMYGTDDAAATVIGAAYFAAAGSTSGDGRLTNGDIIFGYVDMATDSPDFTLLCVTDAAAGDALEVSGAFNTSKVGLADIIQP